MFYETYLHVEVRLQRSRVSKRSKMPASTSSFSSRIPADPEMLIFQAAGILREAYDKPKRLTLLNGSHAGIPSKKV